ncbi:FkbM family methyltransferase [Rhodobacteraceae bacterium RKSG542]|uniref:FkbM family methyltransferase n=1 Tax=Pseudovibrio flavus TaxID=2529854 RepID=UPI0012BCBB39|nr:FkbM family methyltransferase [Pseudovibrio flavus]MTI19299.1 FkbM family methyltransferase [Pseudovibrio flavus]
MLSPTFISRLTRSAGKKNIDTTALEELGGWLFDTFKRGVFRVGSLSFEVPQEGTSRRFRARFLFGNHEWNERSLVDKYLGSDARVLELGGGLGVVSCYVNRRLEQSSAHVVMEADPRSFAALKRNRARNNASFFAVEGAASSRLEYSIFLADNICGSSSLKGRQGQRSQVRCYSIAELEQLASTRFDTLIIDIEGAELAFVEEHADWLPNLKQVFIELHPARIGEEGCNRVRTLLAKSGLELVEQVYEVELWQRQVS